MAQSPRSPIGHHQSRIPGGFDTDDDLSPIKTHFDREPMDSDDLALDFHFSHVSVPAQEDATIYSAPGLEGEIQNGGEASALEEKEMRRRLMDMDSSFLPQLSPAGRPGQSGVDDTFVFGGVHPDEDGLVAHDENSRSEESTSMVTAQTEVRDDRPSESPATPHGMYQTPAPTRHHLPPMDDLGSARAKDPDNTSSLETMSSSPTAAAAARTVSRALSMATIGGYETADDASHSKSEVGRNSDSDAAPDSTPRNSVTPVVTSSRPGSPTPTKPASSRGADAALSGEVGESEFGTTGARKRPKFLKNRMASQRSSYSSYTTTSTDGGSDITVGADYALQSGGAAPFEGTVHTRPSMDLSRTTSLGSMASGVSTLSDGEDRLRYSGGGVEGHLSTLNEEDFLPRMESLRDDDDTIPETPKAATRSFNTPTETVIAQHVRDVQVPATMVREYRDRHRPPSPEKRNGAPTPTIGRHGKNLTLKEQSSTIDRLMKENWDLKLKISFLNDALNRRSDEGVKAIISENVDLRTAKFQSMTETRELKRSVRELERKLRERSDQLAESMKSFRSDQTGSSHNFEDQQQEVNDKISYLMERVMTYEVEIERLHHESTTREGEKRRMAEMMRKMGARRGPGSDIGVHEEMVCQTHPMRVITLLNCLDRTCGKICLKLRLRVESKRIKTTASFEKKYRGLKVTRLLQPPIIMLPMFTTSIKDTKRPLHSPVTTASILRMIVLGRSVH